MTGPHDRVAAREDVRARARVPCRAEACVRAREAVAVRPVRCWRGLTWCDTRRDAGLFWGVSGVYWLRGMGVHVGVACTVLRVGVVCSVWRVCGVA